MGELETLAEALAESWLNGNRSDVMGAIASNRSARAAALAAHIAVVLGNRAGTFAAALERHAEE